MKKKGLSAIIATISIILLTVAAVGFIAGFIVPFVRDNLYESTECFGYQDYFTVEESLGYTCYQSVSGGYLYGISIHAGSADSSAVRGLKMQMVSSGDSASADVFAGEVTSNDFGKVRMLNASKTIIEIPKNGEVRTYVYKSASKLDRIDVYPVLGSGKMCEKSDDVRMTNLICANSLEIN